jgi:hypothetical protein
MFAANRYHRFIVRNRQRKSEKDFSSAIAALQGATRRTCVRQRPASFVATTRHIEAPTEIGISSDV